MGDIHFMLDETDKRILSILANDGRINNLALAEAINLSPTPCARRVKRLEEAGIIEGYRAIVNRHALGYALSAFIAVTLDHHTPERFRVFEEQVSQFPEVIRMSIVTGRAEDYLLQVLVGSMQEFEGSAGGNPNPPPGGINAHPSSEGRGVLDRQPQP